MAGNDINIRIGARLDGLQRDIKKAQGSLTRFANFAESTGRDLSTRLSLPILGVGAAAVSSFAKFEKMELSLKALAEEGENTSETLARLREIALLPGISLEQAAKGAAQLRAVGFEARQAEEILKGLSKAVTLSGEGPEQLGSVVRQLVQMSSKGRILQEDLSVIQENVPSVGIAIKDAFGTNNIEAIRATGVSAQQFTAEIIKAISTNEKFQKATGGLSNEFDNFGQAVQFSLATLGESIAESIDLSGILDKLSRFIERATQAFNELSPETRKFIVIISLVVAAIGPLLLGLGAVTKAGTLMSAGIKLIGGSLKAVFANPVGLVVLALIGLALAIKTAYERSETFRNIVDKIGQNLKSIFAPIINGIKKLFSSTSDEVDKSGGSFNKFLAVVSGVMTAAAEFINIFFEGVKAGAEGFALLLNKEFRAAGAKFGEAITKTNPVGVALTQGKRLGAAYRKAYEESLNFSSIPAPEVADRDGDDDDLNAVFANILTTTFVTDAAKEGAEAFSIYSDVSEKIVSDLFRVSTQAQLTGTSLREMAETSGLQFELGKSVEELGLKIQTAPSFLSAGAESLKAYSEEIALATEKNSVLGDSFSLIEEKINITKTALTAAVEQFGANSAEVEFLKEQFTALGVELEQFNLQQQRMMAFANVIQEIGNEIESLAERGALSLKTFAAAALDAIKRVIGAVIKEGVALAIRNALATSVFAGPAAVGIAAGAGAAASGLFQALLSRIKAPKLAAGGIIPPGFEGDRFPAMLNSGEAVIPLDKLFRVLGNGGGPTEFVVRGADLVAVMGRAQYNNNRTGI